MEITKFEVTVTLTEDMLGTVPKSKEVYANYVATRSPQPENTTDEEVASVPDIEERGWTGFHEDEQGVFVYNYLVKGFLKNAGNVLKSEIGIKNLRSKIDDYVFVFPRRIYVAEAVDGVLERPLRAMTAQGPRVTLARSDLVRAGRSFKFEVHLLKHAEIAEKTLVQLLDYGRLMGLGQFRNGGWGQFTYTIVRSK